jgi:hypothetical protein
MDCSDRKVVAHYDGRTTNYSNQPENTGNDGRDYYFNPHIQSPY